MNDLTSAIGVIGAGAAGSWAAAVAARAGRSVTLLEKTPRLGTKVLASGGTRCNLTTTLDAKHAGALFGTAGARFLAPALRALSPQDVRARFEEWGVPTEEAPLEKIFPTSGRARDVRDALENEVRASGARIVFDAAIETLERDGDAWRVVHSNGSVDRFARLIVCPGGMSYPKSGTTGDGYAWLARLGLPIVDPVPALVPLASSAAWVHELSGIAVQDAEARILAENRAVLGRRRRPVLFTHKGLSGPGTMDLSEPVARAHAHALRRKQALPKFTIELDLVPDLSRERLRDLLIDAAGRAGAPLLSRVLPIDLPKRLLFAVTRQAGLGREVDPRPNQLDKQARHALVETLKGLSVPIDGTLGFDLAEVTAGGLALSHVDPGTMRVRGHAGLYVCGEILDLTGPIGGLNFQAAFATAELAARDAAS
ncbi:MAG: aminoacetone oxidase family FAD-binding enzyme [Planctomycetota bacterium]|nr:aminoacetone oxidase family FAD-binding enzyme [Planctomycetota bacterium]